MVVEVIASEGFHNADLTASAERLERGHTYRDLSTVIVVPTRGVIPARAVENWMGLMMPMNQQVVRLFISKAEVGAAYTEAVRSILHHPTKAWRYMLTLEEDNLPPPDGLLKLYENIDDYAAVGGLYWTKGEGGMPMIYGDPVGILNFIPQVPKAETIQECNGLGMGFTLFQLDVFRDERFHPKHKNGAPCTATPFVSKQEWSMEAGGQAYTQDLYFYENARKAGYRVACDTRVKVGHLDVDSGQVW